MRTIKLFFVLSAIWGIVPLRMNAQDKVFFDLTLNKQDSTITFKVANYTGVDLLVMGSIERPIYDEMKGSYCYVVYRDKDGKSHLDYISVAKRLFHLKWNETFIIDLDISEYMKYEITSVKGVLYASYHPLGEFERRRVFERRTIKF